MKTRDRVKKKENNISFMQKIVSSKKYSKTITNNHNCD